MSGIIRSAANPKGAGRKRDALRDAWAQRFGIRETQHPTHMLNTPMLCSLSMAKSDEARRLLLGVSEKGETGWQPQFGYRRFLGSASNPDVTQSTRKDGNILRTPEACGNVPPGNTRRTA